MFAFIHLYKQDELDWNPFAFRCLPLRCLITSFSINLNLESVWVVAGLFSLQWFEILHCSSFPQLSI